MAKISFGVAILIIFLSILGVIIFDFSQNELDQTSYFIAKSTRLYLWGTTYPENSTTSAQQMRVMYAAGSNQPSLSSFFVSEPPITFQTFSIKVDESLTIPGRIYLPPGMSNEKRPVMLWFYGGGFTLGSMDQDQRHCHALSQSAGSIVVQITYRQAPEHKYPAAVHDATQALKWVAKNIESYGGDRKRIFVGGESAGGNIAAVTVALNYDDKRTSGLVGIPALNIDLLGLVLVYPVLDRDFTRKSYFTHRNTNGVLTKQQMTWFWRLYAGQDWYWGDNKACTFTECPVRSPSSILSKFPPARILIAKHDVLYDEGQEFGRRLKKVGVLTNVTVFNESVHGFYSFVGNPAQIRGLNMVTEFIKSRYNAPLTAASVKDVNVETVAVGTDGLTQA